MAVTPDIPGYRIARVIGKGGFSTVYRGSQISIGREVAVKVDNRVLLNERDQRRFVREVTAAGRLSGHPHVIDIYDAGTLDDGRPYLVMEFCPAGSLADAVHRNGVMDSAQVRDVGIKIADALAAAHAAGVLHRDVKPGNILVNRYGLVGLSDFGLASVLAGEGAQQSVTRESLTPAYASPETFRGAEPTAADDLYSLAATLYDLLAGHPPHFPADGRTLSIAALMFLHSKPVDDIPGTAPDLMATLRRSLAPDPAERPQSAQELRDILADPSRRRQAGPTLTLNVPRADPGSENATADSLLSPAAAARHAKGPPLPDDTVRVDKAAGTVPVGAAASPQRPKNRLVALAAAGAVVIAAAAFFGGRALSQDTHSQDTDSQGNQAAPPVSRVLYSFTNGSTEGWRAGANVASISLVMTFADPPGHPYASNYALDAAPDGAPASAPLTMSVSPAKPLNLSTASTFTLYVDGYGGAPDTVNYLVTVTLASGGHLLSKKVPVTCNEWNYVQVPVGSWRYRDRVTGISVSYQALPSSAGAATTWSPHFQIDDVGYTT